MNEKLRKTLLIIEPIVLTLTIIVLVFFIYTARTEGTKCISNPLVFGAKILTQQNNADFTCSCQFSNNPDYTISVNKDNWTLIGQRVLYSPLNSEEISQMNLSKYKA